MTADEWAYDRVITNKSGRLDAKSWKDGLRIVIEDKNDICSIILSAAEIRELTSYLLIRLTKNEV